MKQRLGKFMRLSPAMVVAMLALFVALTGTAVATTSALITGKSIKNGSVTGLDIKNKSLTPVDFRGSLRGPRGLQGPAGAPGAKGDKGEKGDTGPTDLSKFARVASSAQLAVALNNGTDGQYATELSTNVTSGSSPGFVVVHADMGAYTDTLAQCPCQIELRTRDATAGINGTTSFAQVGNVADADGWAMDNGVASGVFPIGANETHQYDFQAVVDDNGGTPTVAAYVSMNAVYVPFNGAGSATALAALTSQASGPIP